MGSCQGLLHPPGPHLQQWTTASGWGVVQEEKREISSGPPPRSFSTALFWVLIACFRGSLKGASGARMNRKTGKVLGAVAGGRRWSQEKDNHPRVIAVSSTEDWQSLCRTLSM